MRALSAEEIVRLWEAGAHAQEQERAALLLQAAAEAVPKSALPADLAANLEDLPLGHRNALLLALRERTLGTALVSHAWCPHCHSELNFTLDTRAMLRMGADAADLETLCSGEWEVSLRLLRARDLEDLGICQDVEEATQLLLSRCVVSVRRAAADCEVAAIPEEVVDEIAARLAARDPLAEVKLPLSCAACEQQFLAMLDVPAYVWRELSAYARRLLYEVEALARVYPWREQDILAMSTVRRHFYLSRVHSGAR